MNISTLYSIYKQLKPVSNRLPLTGRSLVGKPTDNSSDYSHSAVDTYYAFANLNESPPSLQSHSSTVLLLLICISLHPFLSTLLASFSSFADTLLTIFISTTSCATSFLKLFWKRKFKVDFSNCFDSFYLDLHDRRSQFPSSSDLDRQNLTVDQRHQRQPYLDIKHDLPRARVTISSSPSASSSLSIVSLSLDSNG